MKGYIMFRDMRRKNQLLSADETIDILKNNTSGVLALLGDNGYPYSVPMSYVYSDGRIYFHSAKSGHKTDAVKNCDKASFCVIAKDEVVPSEYTTYFKSVIAFGKIRIVNKKEEIINALHILGEKYNPGHINERAAEIDKFINNVCVLCFDIEHITGKAAKELMK